MPPRASGARRRRMNSWTLLQHMNDGMICILDEAVRGLDDCLHFVGQRGHFGKTGMKLNCSPPETRHRVSVRERQAQLVSCQLSVWHAGSPLFADARCLSCCSAALLLPLPCRENRNNVSAARRDTSVRQAHSTVSGENASILKSTDCEIYSDIFIASMSFRSSGMPP